MKVAVVLVLVEDDGTSIISDETMEKALNAFGVPTNLITEIYPDRELIGDIDQEVKDWIDGIRDDLKSFGF